ncbi:hypothetical protein HOY80DRAFT_1092885 [Tuber brumale]|nr:hypothetical protein HOY80DRAFT_1092885 [Tuber brumale]
MARQVEHTQALKPQPKKVEAKEVAQEVRPAVSLESTSPPLPTGVGDMTKDSETKVPVRKQDCRVLTGRPDPWKLTLAPSFSSSTPNTCGLNLIMRFATRRKVLLPEGVAAESIGNHINVTLSNSAKIRGTAPYVKVANIRAHVVCIFPSLANHSASELENRLDKAKVGLLRDLNIREFQFQMDVEKVKIFVLGVTLADTGQGSIWAVEGCIGDKATDGLGTDLEASNPGVLTAARSEIMGSIYGMRQANTCTCTIKFVVEKNEVINEALQSGKIFLHGRTHSVRVFTDNKPAKICGNMSVNFTSYNQCPALYTTAKSTASPPHMTDVDSSTRESKMGTEEEMPPWEKKVGTPDPDGKDADVVNLPHSGLRTSPVTRIMRLTRPLPPSPRLQRLKARNWPNLPSPTSPSPRNGILKHTAEYQIIDGNTSKVVNTDSLNVRRRGQNRVLAFDLFAYIDVFFVLEPPVDMDGLHVPMEVDGWDLFSFVKSLSVELAVLRKPDTVLGDFNARYMDWDPTADRYNRPGKWLQEWLILHCYNLVPPNQTTFRDISMIDLCMHQSPYIIHRYLDITGCKHATQMIMLYVDLLKDIVRRPPAWKKADWKVGEQLDTLLQVEDEEVLRGVRRVVDELPWALVCKGQYFEDIPGSRGSGWKTTQWPDVSIGHAF